MADINITSGNGDSNKTRNGGRTVVRNSAGTPYVVVENVTDSSIDVWKGNSTTPTSFTEQDTANNPSSGIYGSVSVAIDSSDILHILYMEDDGKTSACRYVTFNADGTTDTFAGDVDIDTDIGADPLTMSRLFTAIAIDSNDIPHIVYTRYQASGGTDYETATYRNRIGGTWSSSVEIDGSTNSNNCWLFDLTIDSDDLPVLAYTQVNVLGGYYSAQGNANDATSFTLYEYETDKEVNDATARTSVCVDSSGNHWFVFRKEADAYIKLIKHTKTASAWDTGVDWGTAVTNSNVGETPSLYADGTDIYLLYENDANDISWDMYDGSVWSGETVLTAGTLNGSKFNWAFWVENDSAGAIVDSIDSNLASNNSYSLYSGATTAVGQSFTGDGRELYAATVKLRGVGSPTGNVLIKIYAHSGTYGTSSVPTGAVLATSDPIDSSTIGLINTFYGVGFDNQISLTSGTKYVYVIEYSGGDASNYVNASKSTGSHGGNLSYNDGSWNATAADDLYFKVLGRSASAELSYTFTDETATPDALWNTLSLAAAPTTNSNFLAFM